MRKFFKRALTFALMLAIVLSFAGVQNASAKESKVTVKTPKISVKADDNTIKVTIKKTENAKGYYIYLKGKDNKRYTLVGEVDQDGTAKRKYTIKNLADGDYSVKVKAFSGKNVSKLSSAKKASVKSVIPKDLVILFTSDVHCGIDQGFTYVGLKAIKDKLIADGNQVILVDDGDSIQGEPIGTFTKGEAIINLMNAVGYDIAIPGNHEFDYGMDTFLSLAKKADFPYISCNFNKNGDTVFAPFIVKEFGGFKIAFVGVTTPKTITTSVPRHFQNSKGEYIYGFMQDETGEGLYEAVQDAVDCAKEEYDVDFVVVMSHLGNEAECEPYTSMDVIAHTVGIDVFLDGHSHDSNGMTVLNANGEPVLRQACGTKLESVGYVRFSIQDQKLETGLYTWYDSKNAVEVLGIENSMTEKLAEAVGTLDDKLSEVVAKTDSDLLIYDPVAKDDNGKAIRIVRRAETNLGDLCADAFRNQSGAEVALVNGGGIRVNIPKGDITLKNILNVHPFGNMLTVIEVTGQQILDALEWGCHSVPSEYGGYPQVSGMSFEINTSIDSTCTSDENGMFTGVSGKRRVHNVMIGDEPIDLNKTYTLASSDYILLNHGDGYTMFDGCKVLQDAVKIDNQVLMDYIIESLGGVVGEEYSYPYGQGRVVAVEE